MRIGASEVLKARDESNRSCLRFAGCLNFSTDQHHQALDTHPVTFPWRLTVD
ncbi:hypothetical protein L484_014427 [Morus notabilis]|uniref:Uncharacterized protein n=1 Tax=Morus notabilis TaxID=981085 RepID=W9SCC1_9ROSA|nr:hypothetical protein L484_014427 [Morus notabilis]